MQRLISYLEDQFEVNNDLKQHILDFEAYEREQSQSLPDDTLRFGKYKGKPIEEVARFDKKYLEWVIRQNWCRDNLKLKLQKYF